MSAANTAFSFQKISPIRLSIAFAVLIIISANILIFRPSYLEVPDTFITEIEAEQLMGYAGPELSHVPGIPYNRVPDYAIDTFDLVSTRGGVKQWQILARKAYMYQAENLVHGITVQAFVYDSSGKITVIRGKEVKYSPEGKDLEMFGDVHATLPDGFEVTSEYMKYSATTEVIEVPVTYDAFGSGIEKSGEKLSFKSKGLRYYEKEHKVVLPQDVYTWVQGKDQKEPSLIRSDLATIYRDEQRAFFSMDSSKPLDQQFTTTENSSIFVKSRTSEVLYGKNARSGQNEVKFLTAYDDVVIQEKTAEGNLNYATSGKAELDPRLNKMILTQFPQVYQNRDTVIGDRIIIYRDQDIVEVENSNAYTEGNAAGTPASGNPPSSNSNSKGVQGP